MSVLDWTTVRTVLAPLVRMGTLPTRLCALDGGASVVCTPEIISFKLARCTRVEQDGYVEFLAPNGREVVLRTVPRERARLVCQIGAPNADVAVAAARVVAADVAGIDLNMGCPKHFSVSGGMGAALLKTPDVAASIVAALVKEMHPKPVSAKIRLLDEVSSTVALMRALADAGAAAITVHARTTPMRPREPALHDELAKVIAAAKMTIPVFVNGDVRTQGEATKALATTGAAGVMVARGAIRNPVAAFMPDGTGPSQKEALLSWIRYAVQYNNHLVNSKWCVLKMLGAMSSSGYPGEFHQQVSRVKSYEELLELFPEAKDAVHTATAGNEEEQQNDVDEPPAKRAKADEGDKKNDA